MEEQKKLLDLRKIRQGIELRESLKKNTHEPTNTSGTYAGYNANSDHHIIETTTGKIGTELISNGVPRLDMTQSEIQLDVGNQVFDVMPVVQKDNAKKKKTKKKTALENVKLSLIFSQIKPETTQRTCNFPIQPNIRFCDPDNPEDPGGGGGGGVEIPTTKLLRMYALTTATYNGVASSPYPSVGCEDFYFKFMEQDGEPAITTEDWGESEIGKQCVAGAFSDYELVYDPGWASHGLFGSSRPPGFYLEPKWVCTKELTYTYDASWSKYIIGNIREVKIRQWFRNPRYNNVLQWKIEETTYNAYSPLIVSTQSDSPLFSYPTQFVDTTVSSKDYEDNLYTFRIEIRYKWFEVSAFPHPTGELNKLPHPSTDEIMLLDPENAPWT